MRPTQLAWLAGYLEGEGCFRIGAIGRSKHRPRSTGTPTVKVAATDWDVVVKAATLMGCEAKRTNRQTVVGKLVFTAEIHGDRALALMQMLLPHMCERRTGKIRDILESAALRPGHARGEDYRNAKLDADKVVEIRRLAKDGEPQVLIARRFGVSQALVSLVITGQAWRHIA